MAWADEARDIYDTISDSEPVTATLRIKRLSYNHFTQKTTEVFANYPVQVLMFSYKQSEIDNEIIQSNDIKILLSAHNLIDLTLLQLDDIVLIVGNDYWSTKNLTTLNPGGVNLLYTFQCRLLKRIKT